MTERHDVRVHLFVRSLCGGPSASNAALERLDVLEREGRVDAWTVEVWGERLALSGTVAGTDAGRRILEHLESFRAWARDRDVSLRPCFDVCEPETSLVGAHAGPERADCEVVVLPVAALAEYRDGDLHRLSPHVDGDDVFTVQAHLDALSATAVEPPDRTPGRGVSVSQPTHSP